MGRMLTLRSDFRIWSYTLALTTRGAATGASGRYQDCCERLRQQLLIFTGPIWSHKRLMMLGGEHSLESCAIVHPVTVWSLDQPHLSYLEIGLWSTCELGWTTKWWTFSRERLRRVLRKKAAVILHLHTFTSADLHLHTFTSADLHLHTFTPADLDLHTFTPADLDLHTLTSADVDLHTFTPADLDLHTLTSADLHLHTLTSADLHLHTLTPADLDLHSFTSADLHLHTLTPADLDLHTLTPADLDLHILTPADLDLHTLTSADLHLHTFTSADLHLHTLTPADLDLHTFTSADLLSLFFYSRLRRGRCRRSATKRNLFTRNGRWTSKT